MTSAPDPFSVAPAVRGGGASRGGGVGEAARAALPRPLSWQRAVRGDAARGAGDATRAGPRSRCRPFPVPCKAPVLPRQPLSRCPGLPAPAERGERVWKEQRMRAESDVSSRAWGWGKLISCPSGCPQLSGELPGRALSLLLPAPQVTRATAAARGPGAQIIPVLLMNQGGGDMMPHDGLSIFFHFS